jgi:hypothetical protein
LVIAQMNVAGLAGIGEGGGALGVGALASGAGSLLGRKPTLTWRSGAAIVVLPAASRIPNRNRFGPTTVSDEMIWGMNGGVPWVGVGPPPLGWLAVPDEAAQAAATLARTVSRASA